MQTICQPGRVTQLIGHIIKFSGADGGFAAGRTGGARRLHEQPPAVVDMGIANLFINGMHVYGVPIAYLDTQAAAGATIGCQ